MTITNEDLARVNIKRKRAGKGPLTLASAERAIATTSAIDLETLLVSTTIYNESFGVDGISETFGGGT